MSGSAGGEGGWSWPGGAAASPCCRRTAACRTSRPARDRHVLAVQDAVAVGEMVHDGHHGAHGNGLPGPLASDALGIPRRPLLRRDSPGGSCHAEGRSTSAGAVEPRCGTRPGRWRRLTPCTRPNGRAEPNVELLGGQIGQPAATPLSAPHQLADRLVAARIGTPLPDQELHQRRRVQEAVLQPGGDHLRRKPRLGPGRRPAPARATVSKASNRAGLSSCRSRL